MEGEGPHRPVLLDEVLDSLKISPTGNYLDATVGAGGHSVEIVKRLTTGRLIGMDRDETALGIAAQTLAPWSERVHLTHGHYADCAAVLRDAGVHTVDGVLADLGVSSMQLDDEARGFSFRSDETVDMRMDRSQELDADRFLRTAPEAEIARVLWEYGEERRSRRIARAVVEERRGGGSFTGARLAEIVRRCIPRREWGRTDPATRTFQALRIAVNDELGGLDRFLAALPGVCAPGGRVAIIAFHSLEDRRVKVAFRDRSMYRVLTKKPVRPTDEEYERNPRARSARLRVAEVARHEEDA